MFDSQSRYVKEIVYRVRDSRGRLVAVVPAPPPPDEATLGIHLLRQGERLDHLAARYLFDPAGFWRICEHNDAVLPEALTEVREIAIPGKKAV